MRFYKKALGLSVPKKKKGKLGSSTATSYLSEEDLGEQRVSIQPSDLDLYESRVDLLFAEGTLITDDLPSADTLEAKAASARAFDLFRLIRYRGGKIPRLGWHVKACRPIVVMSPVLKFTLGADFPFAARWALMQYHPWKGPTIVLGHE